MSDNRKENKKEIDLELKDILLEFLRRWKIIVLFSIIFGLVFGAMRYRKDYAAAHIPAPEVKNTTLEDAYADLDKDQYERVILAVSLKAAIDSKSLYMNESVLMNINAHAEDAVILQYSVEGAEAENIVNSYVNYINSGSIVSDINKEGVHVAEGYLSELIEVLPNQTEDAMKNFTVKVMNSDAESVGLLADAVNDQLTTYAANFNENNQTHILNLDSRKQVQIIDEALAEKQDAYAQETEDQQNKLASIKADMNANQLRVYLDMEKDIFIWGDDEEEQTETAEDSVSGTEVVKVSINKKQIMIGAVAGAAIAVVYIFLAYLLSTRIRTKDEVESIYQTRLLGTVRKEEKDHPIEKFVWKLENFGHKKLLYEQQVQMLISNIYIACRDRKTDSIYLSGSILETVDKDLLTMLEAGLKQKNIHVVFGDAINYNAEELLRAAEVGSVIFIERRRKSYYSEILSEMQLCDANNIQILGMIILEN